MQEKGGTLEKPLEHTANHMNMKHHLALAAKVAKGSLCLNRMCGATIVRDAGILGVGFNEPAGGDIKSRVCEVVFPLENRKKPKAGITCCVHAEQNAILAAIRNRFDLKGSTMYFACINKEGIILPSGKPYCVDCAKLALHVGIAYWVLQHADGIIVYGAKEYYDLSLEYHKGQKSLD